MRKTICILLLIMCTAISPVVAQLADFVILKKGNKTVANYFVGSQIEFISNKGAYRNGVINRIQHDSIFLQEFIIRYIPTIIGTTIVDTAGSFRYAYHYKDVARFGKEEKKFNVSGSGASLLGGGILLVLGSAVVYFADREKFSPGLMAASAGLAGLGYLMNKTRSKGIVIGKKRYHLQYMDMTPGN